MPNLEQDKLNAIAELSTALRSSSKQLKAAILAIYGDGDRRLAQAGEVDDLLQHYAAELLNDHPVRPIEIHEEFPPDRQGVEAIIELSKALASGSEKLTAAIKAIYGETHQRHLQASQMNEVLQRFLAEIARDQRGEPSSNEHLH